MDTILLATDGLKSSAQALDFAIELASEHGSNTNPPSAARDPGGGRIDGVTGDVIHGRSVI